MDINQIVISGRLCQTPELRVSSGGKHVTTVSVACQKPKSSSTQANEADFFDCVFWEKKAELVSRYAEKGTMLIVAGRLTNRNWTDKEGRKRTKSEIIVSDLRLLSRPENGSQFDINNPTEPYNAFANGSQSDGGFAELPDQDGELPF